MSIEQTQSSLFDEVSPATQWEREVTRRAVDELFSLARQYKSSEAYRNLIDFVARFRFYAPFNAMLVHLQMPGATFVAPPHRWLRDYGRRIKTAARPLVILQPMGPVMFVFDVSDTEPTETALPLPPEVEHPFGGKYGQVGSELPRTIENAKRDGIHITEREEGSQSAGSIRSAQSGKQLNFLVKEHPQAEYIQAPVRYELLLNSKQSAAAKYATLTHELAHLYCGHLGTPHTKWWPDGRGLAYDACEFEAESVCYVLCRRLGIDAPSDKYLANYLGEHDDTPSISLDCVMKAAGLIEQMGRERLKPRKEKA